MKFVYTEGNDVAKYVVADENGKEEVETDRFKFSGLSNKIHPFFQRQIDFSVRALKSKGIILNVMTMDTVDDIFPDIDKGYLDNEDIEVPAHLKESSDGTCYCLLRDREMGRGYAVLYKSINGLVEIIEQDHRGIVRDKIMEGDFIRSFGINYSHYYDGELSV